MQQVGYNHVFARLISMPYFKFNSINFDQNRPKIKLFFPQNTKFLSTGGFAPRPL